MLLISWLGSKVSGWRALATSYATDSPFDGRVIHFRSGLLLQSGLRWHYMILNIGVNRHGLYLKLWPTSMPFYPPLFVPWSDIGADFSAHWPGGAEIRFRKLDRLRLELRRGTALEIVDRAGNAWADGQKLLSEGL